MSLNLTHSLAKSEISRSFSATKCLIACGYAGAQVSFRS